MPHARQTLTALFVLGGFLAVALVAGDVSAQRAKSARSDRTETQPSQDESRPTRRGKPRVYAPRPELPKADPVVVPNPAEKPAPAANRPATDITRNSGADAAAIAELPEARGEMAGFLRVRRNDNGEPISLDTSVVRYVPAKGAANYSVDLVGAVHIGELSYYKTLNRLFDTYDAVLFELVMAPGTKLPNGRERSEGMMSGMVKSMLELESQVEKIDYTKKHFVHADLSPQEMGELMRKRGDTGLTLTLSVISDMMREANRREAEARKNPRKRPPSELDLFSAMFSSNSALRMKRAMADQMEDQADAAAFGPTLGTILIDDRNAAAMKVLSRELKNGHRRIAIYYGAAHLPDFDKRLRRDFGLKPEQTTWIEAWSMGK